MTNPIFIDEGAASLTESQLGRLSDLANVQLKQEDEVADLERRLKEASKELKRTNGELIPELMAEIGMQSFTLDTGESIEVLRKVKASISAKNRDAAFEWLRDNGHGSLIKNVVTTKFGRGEEADAIAFYETCVKEGLVTEQKESVHAQTLGAFVREQLAESENIPLDLLGVFEYSITKITR